MCWTEVLRSFSKRLFCASLQRLVPALEENDLVAGGSGVRAQAMTRQGELVETLSHRGARCVEFDDLTGFRVFKRDDSDVGQFLLTRIFDMDRDQVVTTIGLAGRSA